MNSRLKDKWVLITGASSGFGAAAATAFGAEGAKLLIGARRVERLEKVAAEAQKAGASEAHSHHLDVSKTASVNDFVAWAKSKIQNSRNGSQMLDVLINNAGGANGLDTVAQGKDEDWENMLQINVVGLLRVTRAALPLMMDNPGSSIINVGSHASRWAYEGGSAYCGAKAAELQITRTLRLELNGTGILDWQKPNFQLFASMGIRPGQRKSMKAPNLWWLKTSQKFWSGWPTARTMSTLTS
jgi:3-hydroxy acid dehydrogenase/malonic semialdehyde reductase